MASFPDQRWRCALLMSTKTRAEADGVTFVFFNALTGDTSALGRRKSAPPFADAGHGTLMWNFRGQKDSVFSSPEVQSPLMASFRMPITLLNGS